MNDVVIVGGGVVGLSVAWELASEGVSVHVIDRQPMGREASWAGAGMIPPARSASRIRSTAISLRSVRSSGPMSRIAYEKKPGSTTSITFVEPFCLLAKRPRPRSSPPNRRNGASRGYRFARSMPLLAWNLNQPFPKQIVSLLNCPNRHRCEILGICRGFKKPA